MNLSSANPDTFTQFDEYGQEQPNNALAGLVEAINQNMAQLVANQAASHNQMMETLSKPKQIIRGKDGRAIGVVHADNS
jgi:hypothetical protein